MDTNPLKEKALAPTNLDQSAINIGTNYSRTEDMVLQAYSLPEDASKDTLVEFAKALGLKNYKKEELTVRGIQTIAEQRYQRAGQILMLFSNLLDKMNQLKDRLINNIGK